MKLEELISKLISGILGSLLIFFVSAGVGTLKELSHSVNELNVKIGVMVERTDTLQKEVQDHSERIRLIEIRKR